MATCAGKGSSCLLSLQLQAFDLLETQRENVLLAICISIDLLRLVTKINNQ
jgi:hypothetical protein